MLFHAQALSRRETCRKPASIAVCEAFFLPAAFLLACNPSQQTHGSMAFPKTRTAAKGYPARSKRRKVPSDRRLVQIAMRRATLVGDDPHLGLTSRNL